MSSPTRPHREERTKSASRRTRAAPILRDALLRNAPQDDAERQWMLTHHSVAPGRRGPIRRGVSKKLRSALRSLTSWLWVPAFAGTTVECVARGQTNISTHPGQRPRLRAGYERGRLSHVSFHPPPCGEGRSSERSEDDRGGGGCGVKQQSPPPRPPPLSASALDPPHKGEGKKSQAASLLNPKAPSLPFAPHAVT